jgi:hypothetical protein
MRHRKERRMTIPVCMAIANGSLAQAQRFVDGINTFCNWISEHAWQERCFAAGQLLEIAERYLIVDRPVPEPIARCSATRVARAFERNNAEYAPWFDAYAPALLTEESGAINWGDGGYDWGVDVVNMDGGRDHYGVELNDLNAVHYALLGNRTGEHGLILMHGIDQFGQRTEEPQSHFICVLCDAGSDATNRALMDWMPQPRPAPAARPDLDQVATLDEMIPADHPLRDLVSDLEIRENPFFTVKQLALVMNLSDQKVYQKVNKRGGSPPRRPEPRSRSLGQSLPASRLYTYDSRAQYHRRSPRPQRILNVGFGGSAPWRHQGTDEVCLGGMQWDFRLPHCSPSRLYI